jgi:hypothetical protein
MQSASVAQPDLQAVPAALQERPLGQAMGAPEAQLPFPSQLPPGFNMSPAQDAVPQAVDAAGATQAPASLQDVAPQVGSETLQAAEQHAPPRHCPEVQSPDSAQATPAPSLGRQVAVLIWQ